MAVETPEEKRIKKRLSVAKADRQKMAQHINEFYRLGVPLRQRVNMGRGTTVQNTDDQYDIFDTTFQEAVEDFASEKTDEFCPDYRPWVELKPGTNMDSLANTVAFDEAKKAYEDKLYSLIRQTDFYENVHEVFIEVAGSAGGMSIPLELRPEHAVRCNPIMMANLLFDEGVNHDLDGRWAELRLRKDQLEQKFPGVDFGKSKKLKAKRDENVVDVVYGNYRDFTRKGTQYMYMIFVDGELIVNRPSAENAGPSVIVGRWRHNPPNPWGPGPSQIAMAPGNTLDELGYLNLKKLGKEADPPHSYEEDGVFNPEGGIDAGVYVPRRQGSKEPHPLYQSTSSSNLYFEREKLQMQVRRALHVNDPLPRGETPPTAAEYIGETARMQKRQMARRRLYREFVLPALRRFAFVFSARGELEPIRIDGKDIGVEFVSPLSKASDAEEVSTGMNLAQTIQGMAGDQPAIDVVETAKRWKEKLGDTTIVLLEGNDGA